VSEMDVFVELYQTLFAVKSIWWGPTFMTGCTETSRVVSLTFKL